MTRTIPALVLLGFSWRPTHSQATAFGSGLDYACKPGTADPPTEHMGIANFISPGGRLREQLGLTVKFQKTPVNLLVIDSAGKVAAGNEG